MRELIDHLRYVPRSCVWELSTRCNLGCAHCGTNAVGMPRQDELDTESCLDVVE
jgi:MoaA/NifB/PqqE/SkfB family radical SAM enzyme